MLPPRMGSSRCSMTAAPVARCPRWFRRCQPLAEVPAPPLHRVRRLSFSALALFDRCSYRYYAERVVGHAADRRAARRSAGARPGWPQRRSATPCTGCSSWSTCSEPLPPDDLAALVRGWYPRCIGRGAGADRRVRAARTASRSSRVASRRCRVRGRSARSRSSTTASCLHGRLDVLQLEGEQRSRHRLQDELARRGHARGDRRERLPACSVWSTRSPASAPARRRWRSSTTSSSAPDAVVSTVFRVEQIAELEAELSEAIAQDQRGRVPPDAERVHLRRLPGARRRLRRPAPALGELRRTRTRYGLEHAEKLRQGGAPTRRPEACPHPRDHRPARRRASGCDDRAQIPVASGAPRRGDALGADDRRERQPRDREALRQVPQARGLSRGPARGARARHLRDRVLPPEGEVAARHDGDAARRSSTARFRTASRSSSACPVSPARRRTSSRRSSASRRGSSSTRTCGGCRSGSASRSRKIR